MKDKVMDALQRFSKAMFIPVLILPIAGILIAVGNLFTNVRLQAVLPFLNNPVTIGFGTLLSGSLNAILAIWALSSAWASAWAWPTRKSLRQALSLCWPSWCSSTP